MDASFKPRAGEWYRQGGPDKFLGSTLQATLRQAGIKTVIVCGNSFQGATVGTASGAFVEIQGTAERRPFSEDQLAELLALARNGLKRLREAQDEALEPHLAGIQREG